MTEEAPRRRMITVKAALERGLFKVSKLYMLIDDGRIIAYKNGSRTMIDADSLDAFEAAMPQIKPRKSRGA